MADATVKISTTLWVDKTCKVSLGTLKAGDKVKNVTYYAKDGDKKWLCKCTATIKNKKYNTTYTTSGYARYFIEGKVHISGTGVSRAIELAGGKIGDKKTGYQLINSLNEKAKDTEATGHANSQLSVYQKPDVTSKLIGKIYKGILCHMSKFDLTTGWCYVAATGELTGKPGKSTTVKGYVKYKTTVANNIKVEKVTKGKVSKSDLNNKSTTTKNNNTSSSSDSVSADDDSTTDDGATGGEETPSVILAEQDGLDDDTGIDYDYSAFMKYTTTEPSAFVKSVRGIYGMPYQFSNLVDPKLEDENGSKGLFGSLYSERILERMPLLILSPGKPVYMPNYANDGVKKNLIASLVDSGIEKATELLSDFCNTDNSADGKFYSFQYDYLSYFDYVNAMCNQMSIYLGIQDEEVPLNNGKSEKLSKIKWQDYQNSYICDMATEKVAVGFYIDSESSFSESFSNETGESQFSQALNEVNGLSREIQFLMGGASGKNFTELIDQNFGDAIGQFDSFVSKYTQVFSGVLMSRLKNTFQTIKVGGQLVFPDIWNDSSFSRSYDVNIKLRTPDGDNLSWFLNIGVPLIHILCFTMPKRLGYNGIQSPFLVKGYYKGFFNIDMGIVSSLNINKGDKCKWTLQGLPTDIDVSLNIKDLYQSLCMAPASDLIKNTSQLDYIANLCGININKPDAMRSIILSYNRLRLAIYSSLTSNGFLGVSQVVDNFKYRLFEKYLK